MSHFWSIRDFFSRKRQEKALKNEDEREEFIGFYEAFRNLLHSNHQVLAIMGDMQEKAGGAYLFDSAYIRTSCRALLEGIENIIGQLNALTADRYKDLMIPYQECMAAIHKLMDEAVILPETDFVLPLAAIGKKDDATVGGKFALLGELANRLNLAVPPGFVITTSGYRAFIEHNRLDAFLKQELESLDIRDYNALRTATDEIQRRMLQAEIPEDLQQAIFDAYEALCRQSGKASLNLAVRSSGLHEDIRASFAGQYKSALNVPFDQLLHQYIEILVSQFSPRALFYLQSRGFRLEEMAMAVGVLAMVNAEISGILYSRDPRDPRQDRVMVNAVRGLGPYAVDGVVTGDFYLVDFENGVPTISRTENGGQSVMLVPDSDGGTCEQALQADAADRPCLERNRVRELATVARTLENHFGRPQDIEWALDAGGRFYYLQSRPLRLSPSSVPVDGKPPRSIKDHKVLIDKGTVVCRGVASGPVHVIRREEDMAAFPENAVLVVRHSDPEYAALLKNAAALVSDVGTPLSHLATVAREYNLPAVFNTETATRVLADRAEVTVDALYGNIYDGKVTELLEQNLRQDDFTAVPAVKKLRRILEYITPLHLTDPRSGDFSPRGCRTLHDITRFAHEQSLRAMLDLSRESHFSDHSARQLVSTAKLQWWVIDLGDGVSPGVRGKTVDIEQITSIPLRALWEGMTAVPWKGPPPMSAKGFMSAVLNSSSDPNLEPSVRSRLADRNYILVARNFCNVSTRLGFHFSTTEAYVDQQPEANYISFIFTGGGADEGRRLRRVQLISRLLETFDFRVEIRRDTIFARSEGYPPEFMQSRLRALGHVIVHTRQLDMSMFNQKMVDWHYKEQVRAIRKAFPETA